MKDSSKKAYQRKADQEWIWDEAEMVSDTLTC